MTINQGNCYRNNRLHSRCRILGYWALEDIINRHLYIYLVMCHTKKCGSYGTVIKIGLHMRPVEFTHIHSSIVRWETNLRGSSMSKKHLKRIPLPHRSSLELAALPMLCRYSSNTKCPFKVASKIQGGLKFLILLKLSLKSRLPNKYIFQVLFRL